jgi:hypothetical protein
MAISNGQGGYGYVSFQDLLIDAVMKPIEWQNDARGALICVGRWHLRMP